MKYYHCSSCTCPRYIRLQLDLQPDGYHGGVCKVGEHILMVDIMMIIMLLAQSLSPCTWWHSCRQLWPRQPARVQERKDSLSFPEGAIIHQSLESLNTMSLLEMWTSVWQMPQNLTSKVTSSSPATFLSISIFSKVPSGLFLAQAVALYMSVILWSSRWLSNWIFLILTTHWLFVLIISLDSYSVVSLVSSHPPDVPFWTKALTQHISWPHCDINGHNQCPTGTRTRPAVRYFFRYLTRFSFEIQWVAGNPKYRALLDVSGFLRHCWV